MVFQNNLAVLSLVKRQYLPSHARRVICLLLLMAASTEELQHSESICSLDGLGEMWRFGFWVGAREVRPQLLVLEEGGNHRQCKLKSEHSGQCDEADGNFMEG